jgi:hypothetical protein
MNKPLTAAVGARSGVLVLAAAVDHRQQAPRPHAVRRIERGDLLQRGAGFVSAAKASEDVADGGEGEQEQARLRLQGREGGVGRLHVAPVRRQLGATLRLGKAGAGVGQRLGQAVAVEVEFLGRDLHGEVAGGEGESIVDAALGDGLVLPRQPGRA